MTAVYGSSHRHHVPEREIRAAEDAVTAGADVAEIVRAAFAQATENRDGNR